MKDPEELDFDERILVLNILREINHRESDYSDVRVGNILTAQSLLGREWIPSEYNTSTHNLKFLLDAICEYGFIKRFNDNGMYEITELGLRYVRTNM